MKPPSVLLLLGLSVLLFGPTLCADGSVILEFPKLPVIAGSNVTLHCKKKTDGSTRTGFFFRNGSFIGTGLSGEFTIRNIQRSHEGFYWCSTGLFSRSSKSWLSVRDPDPDPDPPHPSPPSLSVMRLLCHLVVVCPYFTCTVLMVSVYCSKRTRNTSLEMETRVEGGQKLAEEHDYVTAYVATEHSF